MKFVVKQLLLIEASVIYEFNKNKEELIFVGLFPSSNDIITLEGWYATEINKVLKNESTLEELEKTLNESSNIENEKKIKLIFDNINLFLSKLIQEKMLQGPDESLSELAVTEFAETKGIPYLEGIISGAIFLTSLSFLESAQAHTGPTGCGPNSSPSTRVCYGGYYHIRAQNRGSTPGCSVASHPFTTFDTAGHTAGNSC